MSPEPTPRIRKAGIPREALLVVRGDILEGQVLMQDAERMTRRYPLWRLTGISGYAAADGEEIDALCQTKLVHFERVVVFERAQLEAAGVQVIPTFRTPHVTIAARTPWGLVALLQAVSHRELLNPYHEVDKEDGP